MDFLRDSPNFFSGPYIDRRSEAREEAAWLEDALADPQTRYLVSCGTAQLMQRGGEQPDGSAPRIAFLPGEHPIVQSATRAHDASRLVLLGWFRNARCVLVDLGAAGAAERAPGAVPLPAGTSFEELRPLSNLLPPDEAALLAYARALSIWRLRHRFCGICGAPTHPERAGHLMRCSNPECAHEFFPRIDPAIIVLVTDGERALLGRQPSWPAGRYSTIAGFVEPGESLEDAVAREVREETGVEVTRVDYHSSQPWPFPSSLMLGFHALAEARAPIRIGGELDDARWFTREEIAAGTPLLPPPHAISFRLIAAWFDPKSKVPLAALR
ncbi:MAG TPA: NAD(+) diphosphatase [Steroidobacteraceae bacterium]|nr:NAD(+) diphosphatase [Steroidobacteraceae bacterium]